jgi:O-antigen ligase
MPPGRPWQRAADVLAPLLLVSVALAVWPGEAASFSSPKLLVLAVGAAVALVLAVAAPRPAPLLPRLLGFAWLASVGLSGLWGGDTHPARLGLEAASALLLVALLQRAPPPRAVLTGVVLAGSLVGLVGTLQALGLDPFRLAGLRPDLDTPRMRVFATLGNPDFVAALLGASLAVTWAWVRAPAGWLALALQGGALAACASWGSLLALAAAGAFALARSLLYIQPHERWTGARWGALAAVLALILLGLSGRPPSRILAGRLYLWRVAAPHVLDTPLLGGGPGSFVHRWPDWEARHWASPQASHAERSFAALQDHAHSDVLEWLLDLGLLGTLPRLALLALALAAAARRPGPEGLAPGVGLAALLGRALVDFPLARPAELCLLLFLTAACFPPRSPP